MSLQQLKDLIHGDNRIVFLTGAGISVASGIRPYRGSPGAVWDEHHTEKGTFKFFKNNPEAFWEFYWNGLGQATVAKPNWAHTALADLYRSSKHTLITQNVDGLHRAAGIDDVIEVHGRGDMFICSRKKCKNNLIRQTTPAQGAVPVCALCGALIRPLTLLFDEDYHSHPFYQIRRVLTCLDMAEALVFIGTSFSVGITEKASQMAVNNQIPVFSINIEPSPFLDILGCAEDVVPLLVRP